MELETFQRQVHELARSKGFWDTERNHGEMIALMHSELSEALEALRAGNPPDQHCPEWGALEIELADTVIRILDFAQGFELDLAGALRAKHKYNQSRPHKHGKAF